jgi:hypothetical protein
MASHLPRSGKSIAVTSHFDYCSRLPEELNEIVSTGQKTHLRYRWRVRSHPEGIAGVESKPTCRAHGNVAGYYFSHRKRTCPPRCRTGQNIGARPTLSPWRVGFSRLGVAGRCGRIMRGSVFHLFSGPGRWRCLTPAPGHRRIDWRLSLRKLRVYPVLVCRSVFFRSATSWDAPRLGSLACGKSSPSPARICTAF